MMQISKLLKEHKLNDITASDENGDTILHLTVKNKEFTPQEKIQMLKILLDKGVDLNTKNKDEETVLHLAIGSREKDIINFLIRHKVHVDESIAEYFIRNENDKFHELSEQYLQNSDESMQKIESESVKYLEWIMSKGLLNIDFVNSSGLSALILAIRFNLQHFLPILLNSTNNINYIEPKNKCTLLHLFLENNSLSLTFYHEKRNQLYHKYTERYTLDILKILFEKGVSVDAADVDGNTALHIAVANEENIKIIEILLDHSRDVNCKNSERQTPFYISIQNWLTSKKQEIEYYIKISRILIARGANINEVNKHGMSPLCNAVEEYNLDAVKFLREKDANFLVSKENSESLLHLFVKKSKLSDTSYETKIELFDMLISNGCKINAKDKNGNTALHTAVREIDLIIVKKLVECGAWLNCKNNRREIPLCYSVHVYDQYNYSPQRTRIRRSLIFSDDFIVILQFLLRFGADFNPQVNDEHSFLRIAIWKNYKIMRFGEDVKFEDLPSLRECLRNIVTRGVTTLLSHWVKLEVANLQSNTGFEYAGLMKTVEYKKIDEKCRKEIETLKDTSIDSRTSLYNFLRMNLNRKLTYIKNEKLQDIIESPNFENQFPEYSVLIFSSYQQAVTRKSFITRAKKIWLELTEIQLPEECLEIILSFLTNEDLFNFIEGI